MKHLKDFLNGLWEENPALVLILGMCPVLAVTNTAINGMAMGLATSFVLICSAIIISLLKNVIPKKVRIPIFIVVIATFVTIVDYTMNAFLNPLHKVLGIYIPLIVVNCVILGRMEAFASKHGLFRSILDSLGMGLGFTWALTALGGIRELLGFGSVFGYTILSTDWYSPMLIMKLPGGAFLTLGFMIAGMNYIMMKKKGGAQNA